MDHRQITQLHCACIMNAQCMRSPPTLPKEEPTESRGKDQGHRLAHAGICGPAEAGGQTYITYCNNTHPSPREAYLPHEEMGIWHTHYGFGKMGWTVGGSMMCLPQGGMRAVKGKLNVVMCPSWGSDLASGHPGPHSRRWGGVPHRWYGVSASTHLANGEGRCPPLCVLGTEQ
jgi:hypothetical protein